MQSMLGLVPSLRSRIASVGMAKLKWTKWQDSQYTAPLERFTGCKTYVLEEEIALSSAVCHCLSDCSQYLEKNLEKTDVPKGTVRTNSITEPAPALSPEIVTRVGSPPKREMYD